MADAMFSGRRLYVAEGESRDLWDGSSCVVLDNTTAQELVLCCECRKRNLPGWCSMTKPNDYCSYGERISADDGR